MYHENKKRRMHQKSGVMFAHERVAFRSRLVGAPFLWPGVGYTWLLESNPTQSAGANMSHAFVVLVALTGLGCQNKTGDSSDLPAAVIAPPVSPSPAVPSAGESPQPYSRYEFETYPDPEAMYSTRLGRIGSTLYSFLFGRDPGIPSQREIEESALRYGSWR
jgi:hypothetical protein